LGTTDKLYEDIELPVFVIEVEEFVNWLFSGTSYITWSISAEFKDSPSTVCAKTL
jgi:hypothetical protein